MQCHVGSRGLLNRHTKRLALCADFGDQVILAPVHSLPPVESSPSMWRHNAQPGCQPKAQTSTERLGKLTPTGTSAPFWASAPRGAYVGRAALSPRIGHFSAHGLARCQPEGGESS